MNKYEDMNLDNILSDKEQLAFNAFSPRDKKLFIMIEVEKKSKTDVAAEFGIGCARVRDVYRRIKRRLEKVNEFEDDHIAVLSFPTGIYNTLLRGGIDTIPKLKECIRNNKLDKLRGLGDKYKELILESLSKYDDTNISKKEEKYEIKIKYIQNLGADIQYNHHIKKWIKCYCVKNDNDNSKSYIPFIVEITDSDKFNIYKLSSLPVPEDYIIEKIKSLFKNILS